MRKLSLVVLLLAVLNPPNALASTTECRHQLFDLEDIVAADVACAQAVVDDPGDGEARVFRAITRLLRIVEEQQNGMDNNTFTDSTKEMEDALGLSFEGRSLYNFMATLPETLAGDVILPTSSPRGDEFQEAIARLLLEPLRVPGSDASPMDKSLADLELVMSSTEFTITSTELLAFDIDDSPVEIDYGDILLLKATLQSGKAFLLTLLAIELEIDIDSYTPLDNSLAVQSDVLDTHPNLFDLADDVIQAKTAEEVLREARTAHQEAIAAYLDASEFIRHEQDLQGDDLFTIPVDSEVDEARLRDHLGEVSKSLTGPTLVLQDEPELIAGLNEELGTNFGNGVSLDLSRFFELRPNSEGEPFAIRSKLPPIAFDEFRDPKNFVVNGSYPDPTFNEVLPEPSAQVLRVFGLTTLLLLRSWRRANPIGG